MPTVVLRFRLGSISAQFRVVALLPQVVTIRSPKRSLAYFNIPVCLFAQPKEGSFQNLQAIPLAELAKSFGTSQL